MTVNKTFELLLKFAVKCGIYIIDYLLSKYLVTYMQQDIFFIIKLVLVDIQESLFGYYFVEKIEYSLFSGDVYGV